MKIAVAAAAWAYLAFVVAVVVVLRAIGERWWLTTVILYLPRLPWLAPVVVLALLLAATRRATLLWTQAVAALVVLFPLMGLCLRWPRAEPSAPKLRVLSYNVNSSRGGAHGLIAEVDHFSPDVVVFQEAYASGAVADLLRARYPTVLAADQFIFASRYPILSRFEPQGVDDRGRPDSFYYLEQILDTPLGRIALYNVHPISPRPAFKKLRPAGLRRAILSGTFFAPAGHDYLALNVTRRSTVVERVAEAAARETDPVIIAGDTNLPGLSAVLHRWLSAYEDGFARAGNGFGYTFPADRVPWMRIDRVLASPSLRFVRFEVGSSRASDHLCVVADLTRAAP